MPHRVGLALLAALPALVAAGTPGDDRVPLSTPPAGWADEAHRLTEHVQDTFWEDTLHRYVARVDSEGTVRGTNAHGRAFIGHTLWAWTEAFRMLAAATASDPDTFGDDLAQAFASLERYYDPTRGCYNAWEHFPGNVDSYSDDNAWLILGLCEATVATGDRRFADRGHDVMERYLVGEWCDDDGPLGMRWGFDATNNRQAKQRASISASSSAAAAIALANLGYQREANLRRARVWLDWIERHCVDADGLVMDGLRPGRTPADAWRLERFKWSYNTGLVILANAMLYEQTGDAVLLDRVRRSAHAAIDREGEMYEGIVDDPALRFFDDTTYFATHLIEALAKAAEVLEDDRLRDEAERNARYLFTHLRDPDDGLYFRNMRLWVIDEVRRNRFDALFAGSFDATRPREGFSAEERATADRELPVARRRPVKTLLAAASVARMYWTLGPKTNISEEIE